MKKILVTGANGYIGSRLVETLAKNGCGVIAHCYPDIPDDKRWQGFLFDSIVGDIRDERTINELTGSSVDVVVHLVSLDHHQSEKQPRFVSSVNVQPTWNLLDGFSRKETVPKFIYFSTVQVYGHLTNKLITEQQPPKPLNQYALTHLISEQIVNYYNENTNINALNVRLSNSYGSPVFINNNCWWLVINDLCLTAFEKEKIIIKSDGSPLRDFIHSSDLVRAIALLIKQNNNIESNTFNIASGTTLSILEIAVIIQGVYNKIFKKEIPIFVNHSTRVDISKPNLSRQKYTISNNKLKKLGFSLNTLIEDGISEIFEFLRGNSFAKRYN